jgi:uncharacterized metal-binding protein YceD (DUF177 family)
MNQPAPEFSRLLDVSRVPAGGLTETIAADGGERERLARRLNVPRVASLEAAFTVSPWRRGGVRVRGRIEAEVEQVCVVSLDAFTARVSGEFERFFAGESEPGTSGAVHHLDSLEEDEPDLIVDDKIDLGEIAAEELALALDPYPRKPGAVFVAAPPEEGDGGVREHPFKDLEKLTRK